MFTNRISGHFEQHQQVERRTPQPGFVAIPAHLAGRPQPFHSCQDIYRYAYECARAEMHERLVALLRSRWDLIHVLGEDASP